MIVYIVYEMFKLTLLTEWHPDFKGLEVLYFSKLYKNTMCPYENKLNYNGFYVFKY